MRAAQGPTVQKPFRAPIVRRYLRSMARPGTRSPAACVALLAASTAGAAVVFQTNGPFGGFFGLWGADVSASQVVGERFVPAADHTLTAIKVWLMDNSGAPGAPVRITLRTDGTHSGGSSIPSTTILAEWNLACQAAGWNPVQHAVTSAGGVGLRAGTRYWVVVESDAPGGLSPVWNFASSGNAYTCIGLRSATGEGWQAGGSGAALTLVVEGTAGLPPRPADLDGDGHVGGHDLAILLGAWGTADGAADLDASGTVDGTDLARLLGAWG